MIINGIVLDHPKGERAIAPSLREQADIISKAARGHSCRESVLLTDAAGILRGLAKKADELTGDQCIACGGRGFDIVRRVSVHANAEGLHEGEIEKIDCWYCNGTGSGRR